MKLRPYQLEAVNNTFALMKEHTAVLNLMFTGGGKTVVFAHIIKHYLDTHPGKKVMVLAERSKIVKQAHKTIGRITGRHVEIEMAAHHVNMNSLLTPDIVVGTVQTQARGGDGLGRLGKFDPNEFGLLIIDECVTGDTLITMADGTRKRIDVLFRENKPQMVMSFDETTQELRPSLMFGRKRREHRPVMHIRFDNGQRLTCTPNHLLYTQRGWVKASDLKRDDGCLFEDGSWSAWQYIADVGQRAKVFDIAVADTHCYFANGILVHNCHHAVAPQYRKLIDYYSANPDLRIVGVTATPDRADERALGMVFDAVAINKDIQFGVEEGWLIKPRQFMATVASLDISAVGTVAGDFNAAELADELEKDKPLYEIATVALRECGVRKTIVFCVSVKQAEQLTELMNVMRPGCARMVSGKTPEEVRDVLYHDYAEHKFQFLVNVGITVEGFDDPGVSCIVDAAMTKSRAKYTQKLGRELRPSAAIAHDLNECADAEARKRMIAASDKPEALYIDIVGNSGRHKPMFLGDVLGGRYDEAVRERAKKRAIKAGERGESVDIEVELEKAKQEIEKQKARQANRRAKLKAEATYHLEEIDPFNAFDIRRDPSSVKQYSKPVPPKMIELLKKQGVRDAESLSFNDAIKLVNRIKYGWKHNLASFRQTAQLRRFGYNTPMTYQQAHEVLNREFAKQRGEEVR